MNLTIKAGADPADPRQIKLFADGVKVENAMVDRARWDSGRLVVDATIWGVNDNHEQDDGAVRSKVIRK